MPVTVGFKGLCALVSETANVETSSKLDVLLVDAKRAELECPHDAVLILPAAGLEDPDGLTTADPSDSSLRRLNLAGEDPSKGKQLRFLPGGRRSSQDGFQIQHLDLIPEMKRVCGISTVSADCFAAPPKTTPIAARVELPGGGKVICDPDGVTADFFSFIPKPDGLECYSKKFAWTPQVELPAADRVVIEVKTLSGEILGSLTLASENAGLTISNLCPQTAPDTGSNDTLVYYQLLDPPFNGDRPRARKSPDCTSPSTHAPGIGCIPFRLSRT